MRTRYAARNSFLGMIAISVTTILAFFARSTVASVLGQEAIGLIALFSDLYIVLGYFKFGIFPSFLTSLYAPARQGDAPVVLAMYGLFRKVYFRLGWVFIGVSILLTLILSSFYSYQVGLYFFLIAFNYALAFFFSYPVLFAMVSQEFFFLTNLYVMSQGVMALLRIIFLPIFPSFYTYIAAHFVSTLMYFVSVHLLVNRLGLIPAGKVGQVASDEKKKIVQRMVGHSFHNVESVLQNGLNNIYVAVFGGLAQTAAFGSYGMIILTLTHFSDMIVQNMTASVGNLLTENDGIRNLAVYRAMLFLYSAVGTAVALGFLNVSDLFMQFWLGKTYVLESGVRYGFAALFLLQIMIQPAEIFKKVSGLMFTDRYVPILSGALNVLLCLALGYFFGPVGILSANLLSLLAISFWQKPYMVYRHVLHTRFRSYFVQVLPYLTVSILAGLTSIFICRVVVIQGIFGAMLFNGIVSILVAILFFMIFFFSSAPCQYILVSMKHVWKKKS
ncbi:hypothetical protein JR334_11485 [Clostridia bacterium]|nr:hypothetical protein JR334_11485 [Clostridia bacterium]